MPPKPKTRRVATAPIELMAADLARSGLTLADAELLGMSVLSAVETQNLGDNFTALPALHIPYYDPIDPTVPLRMLPGWPPFYRVRYLDTPNNFARATERKPQRYMQPAGVGVCAYWARAINWHAVIDDPATPIIITEGEKKAAKACLCGHATIGLGGVWSFRSSALSLLLLPDLARVVWARRTVYIIYDSDSRTNPDINAALWRLAEELAQRGALPHVVILPDVYEDGRKTGLDDYLVNGGTLGSVLASAEPLTIARALWDINRRVAYIRNPGLIIERTSGARMSTSAFKDHAYAAESYVERKLETSGAVTLKRVSAASTWLKWPLRAEAAELTYRPGAETEIQTSTGLQYNVWPGWACAPTRGSVAPFLKLVTHLFDGAPAEEQTWFMRWLAYPLQHPGVKMFTAAVIYGTRHGTGKSFVGLTMGRIYGKNFSEISQGDLESSFNEWAIGKQFVLGDDVTGSDRRAHADQLKKMITQKELRVNQKFVPSYTIPDCLNYYFTSNQPDAFFLEDDDRRYFVHEVTQGPLPQEFYREYETWLDADGAAHLFDYLLKLPLGDFNPSAPALRTAAKDAMTMDVKSDLGAWVRRLIGDPDGVLCVGGVALQGDLFTNKQLLALYDPTERTNATANGLGRELKRAGVVQVLRGAQVRTDSGLDRYYALRNAATWRTATLTEVKAHLTAVHAAPPPRVPKY